MPTVTKPKKQANQQAAPAPVTTDEPVANGLTATAEPTIATKSKFSAAIAPINMTTSKVSHQGQNKSVDADQPSKKRTNSGKKSAKPRTKLRDIEEYLNGTFKFRYNVICDRIELAEVGTNQFRTLDDYQLNSILNQMERKAYINTSDKRLKSLLKSDFTPLYHPVRAYLQKFEKTPTDGRTDNIAALVATMTVTQQVKDFDLFNESVTRWLIAAVANALTPDGCQNHTCLVLTGDQGAFKTTWLDLLSPPELHAYRFTGKIDLNNKDTLILMSEKFIINLDDQLRALNKQDAETVKTLITQGNITTRRPYAAFASDLSRLGSFCASVNGSDFLTDPTGSRRFLPFEVLEIDLESAQSIDMNKVWCEAYHLFKSGYRYWFTAEETNKWFGDNSNFQVQTAEYELLVQYYEPTERDSDFHLLSSDMKLRIERISGQKLDSRLFRQALKNAKFIRFAKKYGRNSLQGFAARESSS